MKALILSICLILSALPALAQSPEAMKYAPRAILLLSGQSGVEGVMPMVFTVNGQSHIEWIAGSNIKESMDKGGQPIRLGDVLSALNDATQMIAKLQAQNAALQTENDKLWKVAMKDSPDIQPPTVVVQQPQQPIPQQPSRLEQYMLLRSLLPSPTQTQNLNVRVTDCTRYPALCVGK